MNKGLSWHEAKKVLCKHFDTPARSIALTTKLHTMLPEKHEKVQEFGDRFLNIVADLNMRDRPKLATMFIYKLPNKVREFVRLQQGMSPHTLMSVSDIIDFAQGFEDLSDYDERPTSEKRKQSPTEQKSEKKTYYCRHHGKDASHPTERCIVLNNAARRNKQPSNYETRPTYTPKPTGNTNKPAKDLSKVTCYKCNKTGHYATECPTKTNTVRHVKMNDVTDTPVEGEGIDSKTHNMKIWTIHTLLEGYKRGLK